MGGSLIRQLSGLPSGIIGFEVTDRVTAEDFTDVAIPALKRQHSPGEVRFVIAIAKFSGTTPGALWPELKVRFENFRKWKRVALITDIEWMPVSRFGSRVGYGDRELLLDGESASLGAVEG
jgi:SpoIIAA-like